jgi:hypothetical protein
MANNSFINEFTIGVAARTYQSNAGNNNPQALNYIKLMKALYPDGNYPQHGGLHDNFGDIVNDRIEEVMKSIIGENSPTLCLDTFVGWFDEGIKLSRPKEEYETIRGLIEGVCQHKDEFRDNIERLCR